MKIESLKIREEKKSNNDVIKLPRFFLVAGELVFISANPSDKVSVLIDSSIRKEKMVKTVRRDSLIHLNEDNSSYVHYGKFKEEFFDSVTLVTVDIK